jgi:WD40 repeat protein
VLASAGLDRQVVVWDVERRIAVSSAAITNVDDGLPQCLALVDSHNAQVLACGTSRGRVLLWDRRVSSAFTASIVNAASAVPHSTHALGTGDLQTGLGSPVRQRSSLPGLGGAVGAAGPGQLGIYGLQVMDAGRFVLTGDGLGRLRTWSLEHPLAPVSEQIIEGGVGAVHDLQLPALDASNGQRPGRFVAAGCGDSSIRLLDWGSVPPHSPLQYVCGGMAGQMFRGMPFRVALHRGMQFQEPLSPRASRAPVMSTPPQGAAEPGGEGVRRWSESLLAVCGSVDGRVYVYDMSSMPGGGEPANTDSAPLLQCIDAHGGRVHAVAVNARYPLLATGSADHTVALWSYSPS